MQVRGRPDVWRQSEAFQNDLRCMLNVPDAKNLTFRQGKLISVLCKFHIFIQYIIIMSLKRDERMVQTKKWAARQSSGPKSPHNEDLRGQELRPLHVPRTMRPRPFHTPPLSSDWESPVRSSWAYPPIFHFLFTALNCQFKAHVFIEPEADLRNFFVHCVRWLRSGDRQYMCPFFEWATREKKK